MYVIKVRFLWQAKATCHPYLVQQFLCNKNIPVLYVETRVGRLKKMQDTYAKDTLKNLLGKNDLFWNITTMHQS